MAGGAVVAATREEHPAGFLGLMRNRNYALLWSGQLVSELGNRFHWFAVSLWIYSLTRSASAVSFAISSMFVGNLLVSMWAGVLVDRLDRKKILVISDLVRAMLVGLIPYLVSFDYRLVYFDLVLVSIATAFFRPAIFAIVPAVVNRRDLLSANSFFTAMDNATEIAGPLLAGILAQAYSYSLLLYVDAASYVFSSACILSMIIPRWVKQSLEAAQPKSIWSGVVEGLRYVRRDKLQWGLFVLIFPSTLVGSGLNALQTPLAKGAVRITDAQFGTFQSIWGVGFLVASLLLGWFGSRVRKSGLILGGFFLAFASTAFMGVSRSFEYLLVAAFAVGFSNTLYYVGTGTVLMEYTAQNLMGRVVSTRQLGLGIVRVVSPIVFGGLAEVFGIREAIVVMSAMGALGTAAVMVLNPVIREFDASAKPEDARMSFWRRIGGTIDEGLDPTQQRRMNFLTLLVACLAFLIVAYHRLSAALGLLVLSSAYLVAGAFIRKRGRAS